MGKQIKNKKNKTNPILGFLVVIVVPIIVVLTLTVIILSVSGVNVGGLVKETGSKIPVISSFIQTDEEVQVKEADKKIEETVASQRDEIDELTFYINDLEEIIEQLELDIVKLENKSDSEANTLKENEESYEEVDAVKKLSASFRKMKKKEAALIFQDLEKEIALALLQELPNDTRGGILEAMDPKQAADLAEMYINNSD